MTAFITVVYLLVARWWWQCLVPSLDHWLRSSSSEESPNALTGRLI